MSRESRYVRPLLQGDETWCQLFSETEAGSDLANITRAVADGKEFVVNGQKVWNWSAHADFSIITHADPNVPKHRGISFFMVDMRSPGVEVRPLVQAQGVAHFNEVFLTDVRIPAENLVGDLNDGWTVTHTTLKNESSMIAGAGQSIELRKRSGHCSAIRANGRCGGAPGAGEGLYQPAAHAIPAGIRNADGDHDRQVSADGPWVADEEPVHQVVRSSHRVGGRYSRARRWFVARRRGRRILAIPVH